MDAPLIGFTFGGTEPPRDRQSAWMSGDPVSLAGTTTSDLKAISSHRIGEYVADYSLIPAEGLVDGVVDAELDAMLAASVVVRRNEGA